MICVNCVLDMGGGGLTGFQVSEKMALGTLVGFQSIILAEFLFLDAVVSLISHIA